MWIKKLLSLSVFLLFSITISNSEPTTGEFLKIGAGTKASALGESFTACADTVETIFYNVAGIAQTGKSIGVTYSLLYQDISKLEFFSSYDFWFGSVGLGFLLNSSGDIPVTELIDGDVVETGANFNSSDFVILSVFSREWIENLFAGAGVKYINLSIEQEQTFTIGVDLGALYKNLFIPNLNVGMSLKNIAGKVQFVSTPEKLPLIISSGVSYKYKITQEHSTMINLDVIKALDSDLRLNFGLEYALKRMMFLRLGYKILDDIGNFSCGAGFKINRFEINYAIGFYGVIGMTHRMGMVIKF